jgi:hypothetical protein
MKNNFILALIVILTLFGLLYLKKAITDSIKNNHQNSVEIEKEMSK